MDESMGGDGGLGEGGGKGIESGQAGEREGRLGEREGGRRRRAAYTRYDILMVTQMSLTVLASVDLMAVQVDVVRQTHLACRSWPRIAPSCI